MAQAQAHAGTWLAAEVFQLSRLTLRLDSAGLKSGGSDMALGGELAAELPERGRRLKHPMLWPAK